MRSFILSLAGYAKSSRRVFAQRVGRGKRNRGSCMYGNRHKHVYKMRSRHVLHWRAIHMHTMSLGVLVRHDHIGSHNLRCRRVLHWQPNGLYHVHASRQLRASGTKQLCVVPRWFGVPYHGDCHGLRCRLVLYWQPNSMHHVLDSRQLRASSAE